jgi:hypothetical protein
MFENYYDFISLSCPEAYEKPVIKYRSKHIIPNSKNIDLVLYNNYSYRNHLHRDSNPGQSFFCGCGLWFFVEANNYGLGAVSLSWLVFEVEELPSLELEPRSVFRDCGLCFWNLLFETKDFGFGALFSKYGIRRHWDPNPEQFFGILACVSGISSLKQRTEVFVLYFRTTGSTVTGTRTQNSFSGIWPVFMESLL